MKKITLLLIALSMSISYAYDEVQEIINDAKSGRADAQYNLGLMYYTGCGIKNFQGQIIGSEIKTDKAKAYKLFELAGRQDYTPAAYMLGECLFLGFGVSKDYEKAVQCYIIAAEDESNPNAMYRLAECYEKGIGVEKNMRISKQWLDAAARNGNLKAKAKTGDIGYFIGLAAKKLKQEGSPIIESIKEGYYNSR